MHFICAVDDIDEGQSKRFDIGERSIFVVKKDAEVYAYYNRCPHLGIELEWQEDRFLDPDGALIQCSTHGALFLIEDGHCISGPCSGDRLKPVNTLLDAGSLYLMDCNSTTDSQPLHIKDLHIQDAHMQATNSNSAVHSDSTDSEPASPQTNTSDDSRSADKNQSGSE